MGQLNTKIVLGQLNLSFYAVQAALVRHVLEKLGHEIDLRQGPHEEIYPKLGSGEIDVFVATWIPYSHSVFWEKYKHVITPLGTGFTGGESFWAVPDYIPADVVSSIDDLKSPDVISRMRKKVRAIGASTGVTQRSKKVIKTYGLDDFGYWIAAGSDQDWIKSISTGIEAHEWFVFPIWQPQFLNKKYRFRKLSEPKQCMGGTDMGRITAHKNFVEKAPKRTIEVLKRISIGVDAITEMDFFVNVDHATPEEAAEKWLVENGLKLEYWLQT